MKTFKITGLLFFIIILSSSFIKTDEERFSLTVKVEGLRNSEGVVQFALYNQENSLPDEKFKSYFKMEISEIHSNKATYTFKNLPKAKYAVNILHDENKNGKIDKGLILPKEGIGFSNYNNIGLSNKPKFSKASFQLDNDKTIYVKIIYL